MSYATANVTATAGSDYTAASATLTFLPGDTSKTVNILTTDDAIYEGTETMVLNLSGATGGSTISTGQGTGTILDNEVAPPSFAINSVSATEGGPLSFTVTKTGTASTSFSVNFATADGTATAGSDYTAASGTLTFLAADTTKPITVTTTDDAAVESSETVLVNLSGATGGAAITTAQGTGTILDNDVVLPSFAINDVSAIEGGTLNFTVTKTGTTTGTFTVNFASANGTATAGSDYTAASGSLTFAPGDTSKPVSISTTDDALVEGNETVLVNLSGATGGATIADSQGVGTIVDNDPSNTPPTAITKTLSPNINRCASRNVDVVTGNTDADSDYPLFVVAVDGPSTILNSTTVTYVAPDAAGTDTINYVIQDSRGAQSTGHIVATVNNTPACP